MHLSIIIPTKNEEKYLPFLLESISKQKVDFDLEIIVSDANSQDKTREIAKSWGCRLCDGGLPGIGRNTGAKIAKGKWLLFLDADTTIEEGSLGKWLNQTEETNSQVATPYVQAHPGEKNLLASIYFQSSYIGYNLFSCVFGAAIIIQKDLFDRIGGFDEQIYLLEDVEIMKRATQYTKRLNLFPKVSTSTRRFISMGTGKVFCYTGWWFTLSLFGLFNKKTEKTSSLYKL